MNKKENSLFRLQKGEVILLSFVSNRPATTWEVWTPCGKPVVTEAEPDSLSQCAFKQEKWKERALESGTGGDTETETGTRTEKDGQTEIQATKRLVNTQTSKHCQRECVWQVDM